MSFKFVTTLKFSRLVPLTFSTIREVLATRPPLPYKVIKERLPRDKVVGSGRSELCSAHRNAINIHRHPSTEYHEAPLQNQEENVVQLK